MRSGGPAGQERYKAAIEHRKRETIEAAPDHVWQLSDRERDIVKNLREP